MFDWFARIAGRRRQGADVASIDEAGPQLVVGLGNPGAKYAANRHNVGWMVLGRLAGRGGLTFEARKSGAVIAEGRLRPGGPRVVLAKPGTFMNLSGGPTTQLAKFFKIEPSTIVVIHDELDLEFDTLKVKVGGGAGGHNGLKDLIARLGGPDFIRVRVGIGRPPGRQDPADWVLDPFGATERKNLPILLGDAADAVEQLVDEGLLAAQQKHHAPRV